MATNKESVRRLIGEGYIQGNVDVIDELCTEDYVNHEALSGDLDKDGEKEFIRDLHEGMSGLHVEILDLFGEGDLVGYRWRATGTHTGMFMGFQPTGNSIEINGTDVAHCEGGRFRELWSNYDTLGFLRQVGAGTGVSPESRPSA